MNRKKNLKKTATLSLGLNAEQKLALDLARRVRRDLPIDDCDYAERAIESLLKYAIAKGGPDAIKVVQDARRKVVQPYYDEFVALRHEVLLPNSPKTIIEAVRLFLEKCLADGILDRTRAVIDMMVAGTKGTLLRRMNEFHFPLTMSESEAKDVLENMMREKASVKLLERTGDCC